MDPAFWQERWALGQTAFHEGAVNSLLEAQFFRLALKPESTVFVPLCGKTIDLVWLRAQGHLVTGIELSRPAVEAFFAEQAVTPEVTERGSLTRYSGEGIEIYAGDFFALNEDLLGPVDAVYDRAALVALPPDMRRTYAAHLTALAHAAPQLLITFEYDQRQMEGPPFSVAAGEVAMLYGEHYSPDLLSSIAIRDPLAKRCTGTENAWLLTPH